MNLVDRDLYFSFIPCFLRHMSSFEVRHLVQLLTVYEAAQLRPRSLYVSAFNRILKLSSSFYSNEYADLLCCLARLQIGNPSFLQSFCLQLTENISQLTFLDACRCVGALRSLGVIKEDLFVLFDEKQEKEVSLLPTQEVLTNFQKVLSLEFSWRPYEDLIKNEFL
ncbi:hypothetical protein CSUI_011099, partial [Cystoisospora suis]